jgi:hypothetical protein
MNLYLQKLRALRAEKAHLHKPTLPPKRVLKVLKVPSASSEARE